MNIYRQAVKRFKIELLTRTIKDHGGNKTEAAAALGLQRTYLQRLLMDLGIRP